jgi:hypothetical protein
MKGRSRNANGIGVASERRVGVVTDAVKQEIEALYSHSKLFSTVDPAFIRQHAMSLLQLSCDLHAVAMPIISDDALGRTRHPRGVTIHEAAARPTHID